MIRKIRKAAVIGSGIMGGGIAALLAGAGVKVLLLDIVPFDLTDEEKKTLLPATGWLRQALMLHWHPAHLYFSTKKMPV